MTRNWTAVITLVCQQIAFVPTNAMGIPVQRADVDVSELFGTSLRSCSERGLFENGVSNSEGMLPWLGVLFRQMRGILQWETRLACLMAGGDAARCPSGESCATPILPGWGTKRHAASV